MSVHVDPYSFLEKQLNHILRGRKVRTESFRRVLKSRICRDGVVAYPAVSFSIPVPPFISMSNGRPNTRFLRVQALLFTLIHPLPSRAPTLIAIPLL